MATKIRADEAAFAQGLTGSREEAKRLIMAGRIAFADDRPKIVQKPGQQCSPDTKLVVLPGERYVSRGAFKLATLLDGFNLDVNGLVCLDAGASTGGFTDCLLQRGAARVYAVDVGKNQLHEKLRNDPRVISHEGVNLRYAEPDLVPEPIQFMTGDLSFISLTLVLPACMPWLASDASLALLVKPQFELGPKFAVKGVVRNIEAQKQAVEKIKNFCTIDLGLEFRGVLPSAIKGPKGNQEYMALFSKS